MTQVKKKQEATGNRISFPGHEKTKISNGPAVKATINKAKPPGEIFKSAKLLVSEARSNYHEWMNEIVELEEELAAAAEASENPDFQFPDDDSADDEGNEDNENAEDNEDDAQSVALQVKTFFAQLEASRSVTAGPQAKSAQAAAAQYNLKRVDPEEEGDDSDVEDQHKLSR
ncbi:hypothetical protein OCU04_012559 [Sclerotinia nivalis]|uniref:Uncharacterized protein n=1 Tax=Sclerotinia nivalis TaxID=352851 RepID=A0A9X0DE91_9HELO|nr:hypothetical protein OCU04_012559 [Sclerotinia nivalis]